MDFLNTIFDIIFPRKCINCKAPNEDICFKCLENIKIAERETADFIYPIYDYRDPIIKRFLRLLKYGGKKSFAKILSTVLYNKILEELSEIYLLENFTEPILIPIPLSKGRYRERGYNQSELLCTELVKIDKQNNQQMNLSTENKVLIKNKETEHQALIKNKSQRLKNLIGSFEVQNPEIIKNKNIILIDDITTTGATLIEAKKVLKKSGARKILAFTIAH